MNVENLTDKCKLYCGDCIEIMKSMPKQSIDFIIADPPYKLEMPEKNGINDLLVGKKIKLVNEQWDKYTFEEYMQFTENWISEAFKIIKPTGSICIFGTYHNIGLINYILQKNNYMIINEIAWFKRNAIPNLSCRRLTASYETILWTAYASKKYYFNYEALKNGDFPEDKIKIKNKQMRNVWDIPTNSSENVGHPTQKPTKLYERLLLMGCDTNGISLDPFAGSGTLGVTASELGIKSILIEKESKYQEIIRKRLKKYNFSWISSE